MKKYLLVFLLAVLIAGCSGVASSPSAPMATSEQMTPAGTATADWQDIVRGQIKWWELRFYGQNKWS